MTSKFNSQLFCILLVIFTFGFGFGCFAQDKSESKYEGNFCSYNNYYNGSKASFKEVRELNVAAGGAVNVDARRNGGIQVRGENRSDVLIRACIQTTGATDEAAQATAKSIRIETNSKIRAENAGSEDNWAVSYEILVPRSTDLNLNAYNGGIAVSSVEGDISFETINGGISLRDAAGSVKGKTENGGVSVVLAGNQWRGSGLDVETTNGGVKLELPQNYQAHIEAGTVNGGVKSSIDGLVFPEDGKYGRLVNKRISTDLNGGGATVRVVTTNGGVKIGNLMTKVI